ncbi:CPBP family intramembrane glutamic endopeptidase [Amycolatopsis sp. NPDC059021]|uniref:CPBP family intramembrane glutamic endopeptidase n=1 Tax=Amycolatopsis sp. NPDC059021 TaxID=3346704 RepID=UPI0036704DFD
MSVDVPEQAGVAPRQYSRAAVLAVWAAAAVPMGLLAWVVAPALAGSGSGDRHTIPALVAALTAGLVWQCVLVVVLVAVEQRSLRWRVVREALWLRAPTDTAGRRGGRMWWWVPVFVAGYAVLQLLPLGFPAPAGHDLNALLTSPGGREVLSGNWGLFALVVVMLLFTTVLGEELLFRGLLLPRMRGAFGRADWIVNGILTGLYHLHQPWSIPRSLLAHTLLFAYPTRRFRSAWLGIAVHSASSVVIAALFLTLVLR